MKKFLSIIAALVMICPLWSMAQNDEPLPLEKARKTAVIDSITSSYSDWNKVSISGKLSSPLLPISASVKIYMERDKLIVISISAPFVGEAARIEIDNKEAVAINKMKKTYASCSIQELQTLCPGGLSDLQGLLLGRISILGKGELTSKLASSLEIYQTDSQQLALIPNEDCQAPGAVYFYTVYPSDKKLSQFIVVSETEDAEMVCSYNWKKDGAFNIDMEALFNGNGFAGELKLDKPDKSAKAIERTQLNGKYTRVNLKKLLTM